jgi:hypothetical protein
LNEVLTQIVKQAADRWRPRAIAVDTGVALARKSIGRAVSTVVPAGFRLMEAEPHLTAMA